MYGRKHSPSLWLMYDNSWMENILVVPEKLETGGGRAISLNTQRRRRRLGSSLLIQSAPCQSGFNVKWIIRAGRPRFGKLLACLLLHLLLWPNKADYSYTSIGSSVGGFCHRSGWQTLKFAKEYAPAYKSAI